jgi:tripartite-type tricarboxylate transporter receptor subunit TctC
MRLQLIKVFLALLPVAAMAQGYPTKPIQVISGTGLGNPGDVTLRAIAPKMSAALGQPLVVETRAGASGAIATVAVAKSPPDGYTFLYGTSIVATAPYLIKNPPYDVNRDLTPVSFVASVPSVIAITASLPVNTVRELIDYAKKNPGKLSYPHTGSGLALHLIGESFNQSAGVDLLAVPYKASGSTLVNDFLSGRVHVYFAALGTVRPHVGPGKVKLIGVINSTRLKQIPDVPTINETLPDYYNIAAWFAFLGPAGLPRPIAERIALETRKALDDPTIAAQVEAFGLFIVGSRPDEFAAIIRRESEVMGKLIKSLGIVPE